MSNGASEAAEKPGVRITDIGHSTMLIELAGMNILTDPWFTDPIMGIAAHPHGLGMSIEELPSLDLILISHGHFDHCDLKALSRMNKSALVVVPEEKTAARIRKLGFGEVSVLKPWETRLTSRITVTALPADHPVPECTYIMAFGEQAVFFGGDTKYIKDFKEIGERYDISVTLLPINGIKLPLKGKVVMDPAEAAEAAVLLKAPVTIPIHYNISLTLPLLKGMFERATPGTPELFTAEVEKRNRQIKVVTLKPGETWDSQEG
jgi:L-ascorbate metabolism protein UlaG (beta-lactamase superfamily)